jgi:hypothetical protein
LKIIGRRDFDVSAERRDLGRPPVTIVEVNDRELALFRELEQDGGIEQLRTWARQLAEELAKRLGLKVVSDPPEKASD